MDLAWPQALASPHNCRFTGDRAMHPILGEITDDSERATLLAWTLWEQESGAIRAKLYRTLDGRFFEARSPSEGPDVPWDIVPLSSDIEVFAFLWAEKSLRPPPK